MSSAGLNQKRRGHNNGPRNRFRDCGVRRHILKARMDARRRSLKTMKKMKEWKVAERLLIPGAVVRARIEFDEANDYKVRPAVVVSRLGEVITLIPCTTSARASSDGDVLIEDLKSAGLTRATSVRTHRTRRVDKRDCLEVLGHLARVDIERIPALREKTAV